MADGPAGIIIARNKCNARMPECLLGLPGPAAAWNAWNAGMPENARNATGMPGMPECQN